MCVCLCVQLWGPEVYRSDPTTWTKTNEARWTHDPWTQHRQPRRAAAFLLTEIFKHWDQTWRWRMKTEGAQLQVRVQLTRRPWSHGSSVRAASLFYWSVLKTILRLQLWFHFHPNSDQNDSKRHVEAVWANLTPDPHPSDGPKKAHEDWMGHAAKVDDTDSPSHQQQAVLTCPSRPGGRLACANVWRISFRRGESYGGAWAFTVGKKRKEEEKHSINNTAGWNISANVRFVLRSKHDAYVPPSISADHQVKYVHLTLTHVCLLSCICKGLKPNQLCSHWHESPPAAACYGGWQKTPGVIMAVTWPVRPVLKIRSRFIGSRGYRWSTDRLVKQPAHLYTHVTQTRVLDSWKHRTEKPGWTSSVRLWKSSSDNKRTGSGGSKQTSRWKAFWRSFSDAWFLNSDIFLFVFLKARSPMPHSGSPGLALPEERNGWPAPSDENRNLHLTWMCRSLT